MNATDYFLPPAADETDLSPWSSILPSPVRILRTNLFGDPFVVDAAGAVYMLDRSGCSIERIAASEQHFGTPFKMMARVGNYVPWQTDADAQVSY